MADGRTVGSMGGLASLGLVENFLGTYPSITTSINFLGISI
jgi:hypothetical protein